jgi:hypothetical protein
MEGYVGRDITEVVLDYGPPSASFDMPDGRTAFQWSITSSFVAPTYATTNVYGNTAFTNISGGGVSTQSCAYTLFGQENAQGSYTIVGYHPPNPFCE